MIYLSVIDTEEEKRKFVLLYEKYKYLMMKVAYDVLTDEYLAEDAVQEAFMKVAKNMDKIGDATSQGTKRYLITVTKNATIDIYRKRNKQMTREIFVDELPESEVPFAYPETDMDNQVLDILRKLPAKYRDVFILKYSSNLNNAQIADLLRITEGNVRQRLARGKEKLQEALNGLEDKRDGKEQGNDNG